MHVQLLTINKREGIGKESGRPWACLELQGILHDDDGTQHVFVYDFWPARGESMPEFVPGHYSPVTELRPDNKTRKLMANIVRLIPVVAKQVTQPRAA